MLNISNASFSEAILDAVPQIVWITLPNGTCTYLNRRWYEFTGQERITGALPNWIEAVHPHDQDQALAAWQAAALSNAKYENQFRLRCADGGFRWVLAQAEPEVHGSRVLSWCGTCTDIHDRVVAEGALKEREEHVRTVLNSIPQVIWSAAPDGLPDFFSTQWTNVFGGDPQDVLGTSWIDLVHSDDIGSVIPVWQASLCSGEPYEARFRVRLPDGAYRWTLAQARPQKSGTGDILRWYGTCTDIHEQVLAAEALQEAEARLRRAMDHIPQMIWSTLPDGAHDYFSPSWYDFTGVPEGSTDGEGWNGVFHPEDQERAWERWRKSLETGDPYEIEYRLRHRSGEYRWVLGRALAERDDHGMIARWHGTCTDIHEQVLTEQTLEETESINRTILGSTPDCIKLLKLDGTILYVNPLGPLALEIDDPAPLLGACWFDLVVPEASTAARAAVQRTIETGDNQQIRIKQPTAKGQEKWFDILVTPVVKNCEAPDRVVVIARDITQQHEAEQALRDSEQLHRSILEASGDCIKVVGLDGRLQLMNEPGLCAMELDSFDQVRDKEWPTLWPTQARPTVTAAVEEARAGRPARFTDFCPTAKGTPKWWDVVVTPMTDERGEVTALLSISRDITATREAADQLRWTSEHDGLTTLPNREAFQAHLQAAVRRQNIWRNSGRRLAEFGSRLWV